MYTGYGWEFFEEEAFRLSAWDNKIELEKKDMPTDVVEQFEVFMGDDYPWGIPDMCIDTKFGPVFVKGWHE